MQPRFGPSLGLYRWILREFRRLPDNCRDYYLRISRSHFNGHVNETHPDHIIALHEKATTQVEFILRKYLGPAATSTSTAFTSGGGSKSGQSTPSMSAPPGSAGTPLWLGPGIGPITRALQSEGSARQQPKRALGPPVNTGTDSDWLPRAQWDIDAVRMELDRWEQQRQQRHQLPDDG